MPSLPSLEQPNSVQNHSQPHHRVRRSSAIPNFLHRYHSQEQHHNGLFSNRTSIRYQRYRVSIISILIKVSPSLIKAFNEASTSQTTRALKISIIDGTALPLYSQQNPSNQMEPLNVALLKKKTFPNFRIG